MTRHQKVSVAIIVFLWILSTAIWLTPGLTLPDGAGYFVYLPSTWVGHDLLFFDEWQRFGLIRDGRILFKEITATDHLGNHWTVGSPLYWYPSYLLGSVARALVPALRIFSADGVSLPYNASVVTMSAVAGLLTLLGGWQLAGRVSPPWAAVLATMGIWFGSPLMWYSLKNSVMSHAVSALACTVVVMAAVRLRDLLRERGEMPPWLLFGQGLAAGFAFIVRPQNLPFALVPLIVLAKSERGRWLRGWAWFGAGLLIASLPQLVVSHFLYGNALSFLAVGGADPRTPWAPFERIWLWEPIFSWFHGLLPWTPLLGVAIVGLPLLVKVDRGLGAAAIWCVLSQWLINASLERSFWGAYAFGQRRFDNCTIFFLLAAAALLTRLRPVFAAAITLTCSIWTMTLFLAASGRMNLNFYYTPEELLVEQRFAVARLFGNGLRFFDAVPTGMRLEVFAVVVLVLGLLGLAIVLITFALRRAAWTIPVSAALYLIMMASFLGLCGMSGRSRVARYQQLIAFNRAAGLATGVADWRIELLRQELRYLEKSGRAGAAVRTRRDLEAMLQSRRSAYETMPGQNRTIEFR